MPGRYNEILVGRYNRFLQKFLSMKGGPPSPQLATELMATWSMFHGAENRYLEGWERFVAINNANAVAAQNSAVRLRNPVGSNAIFVLEKVTVATGAAAGTQFNLAIGAVSADLTTLGSPERLDPRGRNVSTAISSFTSNFGAAPAANFATVTGANAFYEFVTYENQEIPILPGDAVTLGPGIVNANAFVSLMWRERALEESERT